MRKRGSSKSGLFLLEMMISILFFAIAAAVCIQVLLRTRELSDHAGDLNMAMSRASEAAEHLADSGEDSAEYYDGEWNSCMAAQAVWTLCLDVEEQDGLREALITVKDRQGQEIYRLETAYYEPVEVIGKAVKDE
ncbi:MAG: hypothetical protein Q4B57_07625 [Eubacteriales bacterium]|nr:hypothetical protein [Eubacteriales bacterium]